jgi:hypothetical protein
MRARTPTPGQAHIAALPRRKFTLEEDLKLQSFVDTFSMNNWDDVARSLPNRSPRQCRDRYNNYLHESLVTCPWTPEEDSLVIRQYHRIGPKWVEIGKMLGGRSGNSVKNRWHKHLCRLSAQIPDPPLPTPALESLDSKEIDWTRFFDPPDKRSSSGESLF